MKLVVSSSHARSELGGCSTDMLVPCNEIYAVVELLLRFIVSTVAVAKTFFGIDFWRQTQSSEKTS